jgi:hypothetical protein
MLGFYFDANLEDKEFWNKIQECMKTSAPRDLCSMYLKCREKNQTLIEQVLDWTGSQMNKETSSAWLSTLDEHGIDDQTLWEKLGSTMNPDTFLWNIFQGKITKANDRIAKLQETLENNEKCTLERLAKLAKMLNMK